MVTVKVLLRSLCLAIFLSICISGSSLFSGELPSAEEWGEIIDSTWGPGWPVDSQLNIYIQFWNMIDDDFACFQNLELDWDSVKIADSTAISDTLSMGRFLSIMQHASLALKESHTRFNMIDLDTTGLTTGVPILNVGCNASPQHFGAGLTPLPDSSLLVYKVIPAHPLSLEPGDLVLGYDGIPWKELYPQLLSAGLPMRGWWGSSPSAYLYSMLVSAGQNWHLFDTIDIVKYETGDTLHFPTSLLDTEKDTITATDQMIIPGVPMPNLNGPDLSWGMIEGTNIAYIYAFAWESNPAVFEGFIDTIMNHHETTGLIIDTRYNTGGGVFPAYDGFGLLFNQTTYTLGYDNRCNTFNHTAMCEAFSILNFAIVADENTFYDKPIALLNGPASYSAGDMVAYCLTLHPMVRTFGKPSAGAVNRPISVTINNKINYRYAESNGYLYTDHSQYLTRVEFPIDEEVWLTQEGVAQGRDDVVETARNWIGTYDADEDGTANAEDNCELTYNPAQEDSDGDGIGDSCDVCPFDEFDDIDNDGICGDVDNCPELYNPDQLDENENDIGDACEGCCVDLTGNVDCSEAEIPDIADITRLIDYLYISRAELCCPEEADVDVSGGEPDISDITYLIDHLYLSHKALPDCQ